MAKLKIKIESDKFDGLCRELVDIAIESSPEHCHTLLRILQLLLYGEWEK